MFCKKCGGLLLPGNGVLYCKECKTEYPMRLEVSEKPRAQKKMLNDLPGESVNPEVDAKCKKCGNNKAFFTFKQTRSSDEAPTKFFKCTKCGAMWRQYD